MKSQTKIIGFYKIEDINGIKSANDTYLIGYETYIKGTITLGQDFIKASKILESNECYIRFEQLSTYSKDNTYTTIKFWYDNHTINEEWLNEGEKKYITYFVKPKIQDLLEDILFISIKNGLADIINE